MLMLPIVCVCDYTNVRDYMRLNGADSVSHIQASELSEGKSEHWRRLRLVLDGISAYYMLREVLQFTEFAKHLSTNGTELFWLQLVPPKQEIIDYKWNRMVARRLWEHIELEHLMSWLSTLGGGYSALGEQFSRCAETAGKISLKQLMIGLRLGDPFLQARCKLYYSISLIQTGRLKIAKHIVRQQYKFAVQQKEIDGRLLKMCKGIWLRIQYEYRLRIAETQRSRMLGAGDK